MINDSKLNMIGINTYIRRIDLICKLGGPLIIALLDGFSTEIAILANLLANIVSIPIEYYAIARVWLFRLSYLSASVMKLTIFRYTRVLWNCKNQSNLPGTSCQVQSLPPPHWKRTAYSPIVQRVLTPKIIDIWIPCGSTLPIGHFYRHSP